MTDSALLKLNRASKRIGELKEILKNERPFRYIFEANYQTGECSTFAEKNEAVIGEITLTIGEVVQALGSALDHAYWAIVSPFALDPRSTKAVQFPFAERADRLEEAAKNRLAHRVSDTFFQTIIALKAHGEPGGNESLYLVYLLNTPDKHRVLTPVADYKEFDVANLRRQIPDLPRSLQGKVGLGNNNRDIGWAVRPLGPLGVILKKELDIPVDIILPIGGPQPFKPLVPTLNHLLDTTRETIAIMRAAAA